MDECDFCGEKINENQNGACAPCETKTAREMIELMKTQK